MKHQDDGCSAHYSLLGRKKSHKEFLKCAGTDTEYLVPRSDRFREFNSFVSSKT